MVVRRQRVNEKLQSNVELIFRFTRPVGYTGVHRFISNTELSTAERGPSSVTAQRLTSSALLRAVLSTAECLRHRSLYSG